MTGTGPTSPAADDPPRELVDRFTAALERLNPGGGRIGLAVSGGPDSMAMLLLAHASIPGQFEVATVDHGLRPEAKDECALVEAACAEREIPCETLSVEVLPGNVQEQARIARYEVLEDWAARRILVAVATAHHADDQAETFLMRLNRGSGVAGLAGVREIGRLDAEFATVIRPLLGFRRAELRRVVDAAELDFARDPSNEDDRFDRVRIRQALADTDWLDPLAVARSALHLAEANEALDFFIEQFWEANAFRDGDTIRLRPHATHIARLRLVERAIRELGGDPRGGEVARLVGGLGIGHRANLAGVMVELSERDEGLFYIFSPEPPRRTG